MQNSLFASDEFIDATRNFVCIRIETYENKESEKMVRELLNGRFANTAFCVFDPQGKKRLSRAGRSPSNLGSFRGRGETDEKELIREMNRIASRYQPKKNQDDITLQDFLTLRQALNVASADQRLLLVVHGDQGTREKIEKQLKSVFSEKEIIGKFHMNFLDDKKDKNWKSVLKGSKRQEGMMIVRSSKFGLDGTVLDQLSPTASATKIKEALLAANQKFSKLEKRKIYGDHVQQGRRARIYFENEIPYGEDRDGDGKIDKPPRIRK